MRLKVVLFLAAGLLCHRLEASQETEFARRLFDFTPVSTNNPVVAIIDHSIEIPASEFFAYQKAEHLSSTKTNLNLAQKKEMLNDLIGEYLLIDAAY